MPEEERTGRNTSPSATQKIGRTKAIQMQKQLQEDSNGRDTSEKYLEIGIGGEGRKKLCPFRVER